jgi:hypothetical protein
LLFFALKQFFDFLHVGFQDFIFGEPVPEHFFRLFFRRGHALHDLLDLPGELVSGILVAVEDLFPVHRADDFAAVFLHFLKGVLFRFRFVDSALDARCAGIEHLFGLFLDALADVRLGWFGSGGRCCRDGGCLAIVRVDDDESDANDGESGDGADDDGDGMIGRSGGEGGGRGGRETMARHGHARVLYGW